MSTAGSPYCTLEEAAEYLGVSVRTVRRAIDSGKLEGYRIGSREIRVKRADLDGVLTRIPSTPSASLARTVTSRRRAARTHRPPTLLVTTAGWDAGAA